MYQRTAELYVTRTFHVYPCSRQLGGVQLLVNDRTLYRIVYRRLDYVSRALRRPFQRRIGITELRLDAVRHRCTYYRITVRLMRTAHTIFASSSSTRGLYRAWITRALLICTACTFISCTTLVHSSWSILTTWSRLLRRNTSTLLVFLWGRNCVVGICCGCPPFFSFVVPFPD